MQKFFLIGPLRTGSSLLSRCIDDHPEAICLCESEVNRALFGGFFLGLHADRMRQHGFTFEAVLRFLDRKRQNDIPSLMRWYEQVGPAYAKLLKQSELKVVGDKSPDFYESPQLVDHLAAEHRLIYTVRDPRAILGSILRQNTPTPEEKSRRWQNLVRNILAWERYLGQSNILTVRYEDLVTNAEAVMERVYAHLGLGMSLRFKEPFVRQFPQRFLWDTVIDSESGAAKEFDHQRTGTWRTELTEEQTGVVLANPVIERFMQRFGYMA